MPHGDELPAALPLGLLVHFPIQQNAWDHAEILAWSPRFNCPDLQHRNLLALLRRSIERHVPHRLLTIVACVQESVAALISVAFEYPNTLISLVFHQAFECSFVEDIEVLRAQATFPSSQLSALQQTVLSCHSHGLQSNKTIENHALFQTLLTPIDIDVMRRYQVDYLDVLTCDRCLLEVIREIGRAHV